MALKTSIARRYARAILLTAKELNRIQQIKDELQLLKTFFDQNPDILEHILNPAFDKNERKKILEQMVSLLKLSPETGNFILLLNLKSRLADFNKIYQAFLLLSDEVSGIKRARIYSARELNSDSKEKLIRALEKRTRKKVIAEFMVDPELIGGVKIQIGSLLLDGSIKAQLKLLEEKLLQA